MLGVLVPLHLFTLSSEFKAVTQSLHLQDKNIHFQVDFSEST